MPNGMLCWRMTPMSKATRKTIKFKPQFDDSRLDYKPTSTRRDVETQAELEEYLRCAVNPLHFLNNYCMIQDPVRGRLPFLLYPFQRTAVKLFLTHVFNIVLKPRQMGLSWLTALFALWFAMFRQDQTVEIISIKEDTAKRFMDKIKFAYRYLPDWLKGEIKSENTSTIVFSNGSRIMSVPTSEEAGRSEGISLLIVDEAAFVRWIDKIWASAFPTLSTGGMAILISTANGMGNFFANKWRDASLGTSGFNPIKLHWKMHPDRDEAWYLTQRRELGPALCAQEVDCDFLNSGRPVFDTSILTEWGEMLRHRKPLKILYAPDLDEGDAEGLYGKRAEGLYIYKKPQPGKFYIIGGDISAGGGDDYCAAQVVDWDNGEQCAELRLMCKPNEFASHLFALGKMYNWGQLVPERTGMGLMVVQKLVDMDYPNIYQYLKEDATIDEEVSTKSVTQEKTLMLGFNTTVGNRPVLIAVGEELIREHDRLRTEGAIPEQKLLVNGLRTINEMLVFNHQDTGKPNPRANAGYNDDLVMAWFIAQLARSRYKPTRELPVLFT